MLIFMTISTEVFPVRAIRRVIQVVPVFMVYGKEVPVFEIEFPSAFGADQAMDFQGLFPVPGVSFSCMLF